MKKFLAAAISMLAMFPNHTDAEPIPMRGIVEGFYGEPWSLEDRLDMIDFCAAHGFNAYIYAPKDDPYHREKWRKSYPKSKLKEIQQLVEKSKEKNIEFIFAISPGLNSEFNKDDLKKILKKISTMKSIGINRFAIFFDDIPVKRPEGQAEFLNSIAKELDSEILTVPTEYFRPNMQLYTETFAAKIDSKILPLYTGEAVVGNSLSDEDYSKAVEIYHRPLGIWWNYPVNDYMKEKIALGAIENLPRHSEIPAIFFNPMSQSQLSKIALATGADYALDPRNYDSKKSWNRAIEDQFGDLAPAMKIFADHSMHMENSWAKVGAEDGKRFRETADRFFDKFDEESLNSLQNQINETLAAIKTLRDQLPPEVLEECSPQLDQLERIAEADKVAAYALTTLIIPSRVNTQDFVEDLKSRLEVINRAEESAKISETSMKAFLTRTIDFLGGNKK